MAITPAQLVILSDFVGAGYLALAGSSGSGFGCGNADTTLASDWGFSKAARQLQAALMATQDFSIVKILGDSAADIVRQSPVQNVAASMYMPLLSRLNQTCALSGLPGVTSLETFALYYNTGAGGPNNCRLSPAFGQVYHLALRSALAANCLYTAGAPPGGRTNQPVVPGVVP